MKRGFYCSKCKKRFSIKNNNMYVVHGKQYCKGCKDKLKVTELMGTKLLGVGLDGQKRKKESD